MENYPVNNAYVTQTSLPCDTHLFYKLAMPHRYSCLHEFSKVSKLQNLLQTSPELQSAQIIGKLPTPFPYFQRPERVRKLLCLHECVPWEWGGSPSILLWWNLGQGVWDFKEEVSGGLYCLV